MAKKRAGWERLLLHGTAGSTAATAVDDNVADIDIGGGNSFSDTTDRGDGSAVPKETEQVVRIKHTPSWTMKYYDGDTNVAAFLAAARAGTGIAIKVVRYTGGETEFDGDVYLDYESPGPLDGGMEITFTGHPTDDYGRTWTAG